ncbi:MAG: response regulator [Acidobacteriaceae bacterium]
MSDKILFVDDESSALDGFRRVLHGSFNVCTAGSGGEGLMTLDRDGPFAVVVSDMRMPGMDGAEFLARVRQKAPHTVRMLLTGHADLRAAMDAVNRGQILHFLTKPCPRAVLVAALNSGLDQYHASVEENELANRARSMQRRIDWSAATPSDWDQFQSPAGLPGPSLAKTCLEPLVGKDAQIYTVLLRLPVLDTVEQRYGEGAAVDYFRTAAGFLQHSLSAGDRLFHWRREILLAVLRRYISPAAVRMEIDRLIAETRGYIIEVHNKPTMIACLITFDILPAAQFSGFAEWLATFEARCSGQPADGAGAS